MRKFFILAAMASVMLGSCSKDNEELPVPDPEPDPGSGVGTLVIKPEIQAITGNAPEEAEGNFAFAGYAVTLKGPGGGIKTLDFPENGTVENLSVGKYDVTLNSHKEPFSAPAFETPVYEGSAEATVSEDKTTEVTVTCTQTNAGIFFIFDASLENNRYSDIKSRVTYEGKSLAFEGDDRDRKGYFPAGDISVALEGNGDILFIDKNETLTMEVGAAQLWKMTLKADENSGKITLSAEEANDPENVRTWTVSGVPPTLEGTPVEGSELVDFPEDEAGHISSIIVTGSIPSEEAWRALNKFTGLEYLYIYDDDGAMPDNLFYDEVARRTTMPKLTLISARHLTGIGSHSVYASNIEVLEAPELKTVGLFGLAGCMNLTSLSLPEVETLGNYAFSECTGLTFVELPKLQVLSQGTFDMCTSLTEVSVPEATEGGSGVFHRCYALETVSLPKLAKAGKNFLSHCAKLKTVDLPELTQGDEAMFAGCSSLTSLGDINMPKLETVPQYMFYNCANLTSAAHDNVTSIGPMAFQECPLLESVSFPNVTKVDMQAFETCPALHTVSLPKAETIAEKAFYKCTGLTKANIPSAREIGDFAFCLDEKLSDLTMHAVETIGNSAFYDTAITNLDMPELTSCGKEAFRKCASLESVSMAKLTSLSNYMFGECTSLRTVRAPAAETSADGHVFNGCSALESLSLPSMKVVGMNLAANATSLKEVSLPLAETVGNNAFARAAITEIDLPNAASLGTYVFDRCTKLTIVKTPKVTSVGNYCFTECTSLKSIELPLAETVSLGTFNKCTALESVNLPVANNIGKWSFRNCTSLKELRFGAPGAITFGDLVFAHLPVQDPQTITPDCTLKLSSSGTELGNAEGNVWKGYTWKAIESYIP